MTKSRWPLQPRLGGLGHVNPTCVALAVLTLVINVPIGVHGSNSPSTQTGLLAGPALLPNGTAGLVYGGRTSLGPPGNTPYNIVYDNRTGRMFATEGPSYVVVLSGSPTAVTDSIFLGLNSYPEGIAYDPTNNTVFVGILYPQSVVVVSGTNDTIVERVPLGFYPWYLTYDSATDDILVPGPNLTVIGGSTYAVSSVGLPIPTYGNLQAALYDPITQSLVVMGFNTQLIVFGWVIAINPTNGSWIWEDDTDLDGQYSGLGLNAQNGSLFVLQAYGPLLVINGSTGANIGQITSPGTGYCSLTATPVAYDPNSSDLLVGGCGGVVRSVDTRNGTVGPPVFVGGTPEAIALNSSSGDAFVLNWDTNTVAILTPNGSAVLTRFPVGGAPNAIAIDNATGTAYVLASNNVSIINLSNHRLVGSIDVGVSSSSVWQFIQVMVTPESILYDPASREIFVANSGNGTVSVISTESNTVVATVPVAIGPLALAWNNETNEIYVACAGLIDIVSPVTWRVVATISLGGITPDGVAYVPSLNEVFVDNNCFFPCSNPNITVISASTDRSIASISLPSEAYNAGQVVYDSGTGDLYVTGAGMGFYTNDPNVFVVNPANRSFVGNISVGIDPYAIAPDPGSSHLFGTAGVNGTVSLISGTARAVTYSVALPPGTVPQGVAYDSSTGQVLVAGWGDDSVSYLIPEQVYPVALAEIGLPAGTPWAVTVNGTTTSSITPYLNLTEPNGSFPFTVSRSFGYLPTPASGEVIVSGSGRSITIAFAKQYEVWFNATGLPNRVTWGVTLGTTVLENTTVGGAGSVEFVLPNGSFPYSIQGLEGYHESTIPYSGILMVNGSNLVEDLPFGQVIYSVTFSEFPLPLGTNWSVSLGGTTNRSTGLLIGFAEPNGTYSYAVGGIPGWHLTSFAQRGSVTVNGTSVEEAVGWTVTTYVVTITENGLPNGTSWGTFVGGSAFGSTANAITFEEPNGTYSFKVDSEAGYVADLTRGSITVLGVPVSLTITFEHNPGSPARVLGLPSAEGYALLGGIAAAVIVVAALVTLRYRRGKTPPNPVPKPIF
jgi:YVTN family beta-propeller protein